LFANKDVCKTCLEEFKRDLYWRLVCMVLRTGMPLRLSSRLRFKVASFIMEFSEVWF
jgi:hypothetical protein